MKKLSRRNFIVTSSAFAASTLLSSSSCRQMSALSQEEGHNDEQNGFLGNKLIVDKHITLYADHHLNTLPSVGRLGSGKKSGNGKLFLTFRQAPDWSYKFGITDIDHASEVVHLTSSDGEVWDSEASELYANFLHGVDRPAVQVLQDGSLFCTFVMWQVEVKTLDNESKGVPVFGNWVGFIRGSYSLRSTDGGKSWDEPIALPGSQAIGQESVELADGSILCSGYAENITIYKTRNKGLTWDKLSTIPRPAGYFLTEPVLYRTNSGKVVCYGKGVPETGSGEQTRLITAETVDGGVTWTNVLVRKADYIGAPHLLRLNNDAVLLSYKYSHTSAEIRGAVLNTECTNVDDVSHQVLRSSGLGVEAGNTSAVMLSANKFLVVYSNFDSMDGKRHIAGTVCNIATNG